MEILTSIYIYIYIYIFRHFVGEDLDPLSLRELQNLEQQLDTALKRIRTRKVGMNLFFFVNVLLDGNC